MTTCTKLFCLLVFFMCLGINKFLNPKNFLYRYFYVANSVKPLRKHVKMLQVFKRTFILTIEVKIFYVTCKILTRFISCEVLPDTQN